MNGRYWGVSLRASSPIWASETSLARASGEVFLRKSAIMMETAWGKLLIEIFYQRRFFPQEQGRAQFPIDSSERSFWVNVDFVSKKT